MYFIRVNGHTAHNNPNVENCFVPGEPPEYPQTFFSYYSKCLADSFVRIGWPGVGNLMDDGAEAVADCYNWQDIPRHVAGYLHGFSLIPIGSTVLMPNSNNPGELAIGSTTSEYYFSHHVPDDPYECAHRIRVRWDTNEQGNPIQYQADELGIDIHGGWWRRAFHHIVDANVIAGVEGARHQ
ncbi:MAG: hypothetical protein OXK20_00735 [Deltaproteobacteria bacterium]|nr:hypothetical protein [Deltaproteobacteria bacterium]